MDRLSFGGRAPLSPEPRRVLRGEIGKSRRPSGAAGLLWEVTGVATAREPVLVELSPGAQRVVKHSRLGVDIVGADLLDEPNQRRETGIGEIKHMLDLRIPSQRGHFLRKNSVDVGVEQLPAL